MSGVTSSLKAYTHISDERRKWFNKQNELLSTDGYAYLIEGAGLYKIGCSTNVRKRMMSMAGESPVPLTLVAAGLGGAQLEGRLHLHFSHVRSHGEWFRLSPEQVETCLGLMQARRLPPDLEEAMIVLRGDGPRPGEASGIEGTCDGCGHPLEATDHVRWIDRKPYHASPCWNTKRKQLARARKRRADYLARSRR